MPNKKELKQIVGINQKRPELFSERILKSPPLEEYQIKIMHSVRDHERTVASACHNIGKTFTAAEVALWFLYNFKSSKVITTAPTFRQVELLLWKELHTKVSQAGGTQFLGGKLTNTKLEIAPDWFAVGFKPDAGAETKSDRQMQSNFQGFHAKYILIIFDEATGILKSIWDQVEGMLTSGHVRFLAIGNPTDPTSQFAECFKDPFFSKIKLSCFDSPNFKANGIHDLPALEIEYNLLRELPDADKLKRVAQYKIVHPSLLSVRWVLERALKWGLNHPLFVSKCLGEFPSEADNVLIPLRILEASQARTHVASISDRRTIGVDVARYGTDETVITRMHGAAVLQRTNLIKRDTSEVTGAIIDMIRACGDQDVIVVDGTGIGAGVVDQLKTAQNENVISRETEIREVHFGASADKDVDDADQAKYDREHFVNLKAKMFQLLADDLKNNIALLPDEIYLEELPTIIYGFDSKGRLVIESKDAYKKRTGRNSPDNADSLMLANYGRYGQIVAAALIDTKPNAQSPIAGPLNSGDNW